MSEEERTLFLNSYRERNHVSPFRNDEEFYGYIEEGIEDINSYCGVKVDYKKNKKARSLLMNYVLFADYKKTAEFKAKYISEYDELQRDEYIKFLRKSENKDE